MDRRTFQLSSELFWGYRVTIHARSFGSIQDIAAYVRAGLISFLLSRNLVVLAEKVHGMTLHMHGEHGSSLEALLEATTPQDILYLCDHCGG